MSSGGSSGGSSAAAGADACAFAAVSDYTESLNVGAVFVILVASLVGTSIPLVSKRYPSLSRYPFVFIWGSTWGRGCCWPSASSTSSHPHSMSWGTLPPRCLERRLPVRPSVLSLGRTGHALH